MKAMILSAGFGTRLMPLTAKLPKALVPVGNEPIINHTVRYLLKNGITSIAVNTHHHHQQMLRHIKYLRESGIDIHIRIEEEILGTGGGIKNFSDFFEDASFVVINADIITEIPLLDAYASHKISGGLVTLVLTRNYRFNQILIDSQNHVIHIDNEPVPNGWTFTGIHIIEPEIFNYMPEDDNFDIIAFYRRLLKKDIKISAYTCTDYYWHDIGTISSYMEANRRIVGEKRTLIGEGSQIHPSLKIQNWAVIGRYCMIEEDTMISSSIIWDNVTIKKGSHILDSIIMSGKSVKGKISKRIY
jgi:NDP-sugar pyrophosphorylase family protein